MGRLLIFPKKKHKILKVDNEKGIVTTADVQKKDKLTPKRLQEIIDDLKKLVND